MRDVAAKTRADLGWDQLLQHLAERARTTRGQRLCSALSAIDDIDALRARHEEVSEARALRDVGEGIPLDGVRDIDEALRRAGKSGALDPQALRDVASTLAAAAGVRRHLTARASRAPRLVGRAALIDELVEVWEPIEDAFEGGGIEPAGPDAGPDAVSRPRLADRASPALASLRRRALAVREELEKTLGALLDKTHIAPHLQDRFATQREDRYVIPIRVDARAKVRGIVHGTSQSGQTVFVEPEEIVELNNRLKLAELEVAEEERRILAELSRLVEDALPRITANLEILAMLDLLDASGRLSADLRAAPPELFVIDKNRTASALADADEGGGGGLPLLDLRRARHPLMVLSGRTCVPNDIVLTAGKALVVSGPNAGGKTVALKTAGLAVLMATAGLHIAAQEGSKVPTFEAVLTDVGDDQSLERNLSTFSAHVMHLREFLAAASPSVLVLLDEVAVGTDPDQGAALAQAVLEALVARGATVIVTTHYDRLKALAASDARFVNASVGFDVDKLAPTYQLHLGVPGASGAIVVARRLGMIEPVCARATTLAGERTQLESLLLLIEAERRRLERERADVASERARVEALAVEAERKLEQAKERLEAARKGAHDDAMETLRRARLELDRTRAVLRRSGDKVTPAEVSAMKREIDEAARAVHEAAPRPEPPPGRPADPASLKAGVEVWVKRLGGRAQVVAPPKGDKVAVQAGPLKVTVALEEVRLVDGAPSAPQSARARRGHSAFDDAGPKMPKARGAYPELDVRGERAEAAIALAEKFLDDAMRAGTDGVLIVHGHGTGALRDRVREHFRGYPGVTALRPGQPDEGGDGVTILVL
jgi:DNA mismatch repair protein MutS2